MERILKREYIYICITESVAQKKLTQHCKSTIIKTKQLIKTTIKYININ